MIDINCLSSCPIQQVGNRVLWTFQAYLIKSQTVNCYLIGRVTQINSPLVNNGVVKTLSLAAGHVIHIIIKISMGENSTKYLLIITRLRYVWYEPERGSSSVSYYNLYKYMPACKWVSHNALLWESQTHSVNDSIYDFDRVFLEIPVKNCIVGMLLTCPI